MIARPATRSVGERQDTPCHTARPEAANEDRVFMPAILDQEMIADILHCKIATRAFPVLGLERVDTPLNVRYS